MKATLLLAFLALSLSIFAQSNQSPIAGSWAAVDAIAIENRAGDPELLYTFEKDGLFMITMPEENPGQILATGSWRYNELGKVLYLDQTSSSHSTYVSTKVLQVEEATAERIVLKETTAEGSSRKLVLQRS